MLPPLAALSWTILCCHIEILKVGSVVTHDITCWSPNVHTGFSAELDAGGFTNRLFDAPLPCATTPWSRATETRTMDSNASGNLMCPIVVQTNDGDGEGDAVDHSCQASFLQLRASYIYCSDWVGNAKPQETYAAGVTQIDQIGAQLRTIAELAQTADMGGLTRLAGRSLASWDDLSGVAWGQQDVSLDKRRAGPSAAPSPDLASVRPSTRLLLSMEVALAA